MTARTSHSRSTPIPNADQDDRRWMAAISVLFALSLSMSAVAIPLYALDNGMSKGAIGLLVSVSALAQIVVRSGVPRFMGRFGEDIAIGAGCAAMACGCLVTVANRSVVGFAVAQLLIGLGRAGFWTGAQTHAVRDVRRGTAKLVALNTATGAGMLLGPLLAGLVGAVSMVTAVLVSALPALLSVPLVVGLRRHPRPAAWRTSAGGTGLWRERTVVFGSWAGVACGSWRALLNAYVPVALEDARLSTQLIGVWIALASAASIAGSAYTQRLVGRASTYRVLIACAVCTCVGIALIGIGMSSSAVILAALLTSGLGAGVLETLGPDVAAGAVRSDQKGGAIATAGMYRAVAMFAAPSAMAGTLSILPIGAAWSLFAAVLLSPAAVFRAEDAQRRAEVDGPPTRGRRAPERVLLRTEEKR